MILLGEKIYGRRKDLGLTQRELAIALGSSQRIVSELEHGTYAPSNGIGENLYDRLADVLKIDRDYLFSDKIDRTTFELFSYLQSKLSKQWDIMQFMKIPYFIDLDCVKSLGTQLTNFKYIRYTYGPFDKNIYKYWDLFGYSKIENITYSYINDYLEIIDNILSKLPIDDGTKLKALSYETEPLKAIGATPTNKIGMNERLNLNLN